MGSAPETRHRARSRAEVRELDRRAIEEYGMPSFALMENAGRACADEVERLLAAEGEGPVVVLCGPGNNGGDGLVIARTLHNRGAAAEAWFAAPLAKIERLSDDVRLNAELYRGLGLELREVADAGQLEELRPRLSGASVIVDALFGTGLTRPLEGHLAALVDAIGDAGAPVLAVDLPSGLDADTGEVLGRAVEAEVTVTFVAPKLGFDRAEGPGRCGRVVIAEIGIPRL